MQEAIANVNCSLEKAIISALYFIAKRNLANNIFVDLSISYLQASKPLYLTLVTHDFCYKGIIFNCGSYLQGATCIARLTFGTNRSGREVT